MTGRSIRIYLVDGTASGVMTAEIMNWTGKVIVAPRTQLADLARRGDSKRTGVYVLTGEDPHTSLKELVYIGESDNVLNRLTQHNTDATKDFWSRTLVVISKDENLTKAHVRYLESRLIQISTQARRATLKNGTAPAPPTLPEPDVADMEFFLSQLQTLLPVLGFSFATPTPTIQLSASSSQSNQVNVPSQPIATTVQPTLFNSPMFSATATEYAAEAQEINGEFVLLQGSRIRKASRQSLGETFLEIREQLRKDGKVIDHPDGVSWELTTNVAFSSPSAAAKIVSGTSVNGREFWKVKATGQTYNQWDQSRIVQAQAATTDGS